MIARTGFFKKKNEKKTDEEFSDSVCVCFFVLFLSSIKSLALVFVWLVWDKPEERRENRN